MAENNETLGRRIARLRLLHGMTQERLAGELGVTSQAVSKWENDLSAPDIMLLPALARTLDVTVDELLEGKAALVAEEAPAELPEPEAERAAPEAGDRPRTLHIRVQDGDDSTVNINVPISVASLAMRAGKHVPGVPSALGDLDVDAGLLSQMLKSGEKGTLLEVHDGDDHVTITLE